MSMRAFLAPVLLAALVGCGGNPFVDTPDPVDPVDPVDPTDPVALLPGTVSGAVAAAGLEGWTSGAPTFAVRMTAQDATNLTGTYVRAPALDTGGYEAYTFQTSTSNRFVVAMVRKVDGLAGMIAVDAGQFANYHGGGQVWRADVFEAPEEGVGGPYNYSGTYVGLLNTGPNAPGGPGGTLNPGQSDRVVGRALVTADFTEMRVSGGVDQRVILSSGTGLPDIALEVTEITTDGTFTNEVMRLDPTWTSAGTYGGIFNADGTAVSIVMVFNPTNAPQLFEHGLLVLDDCVSAGGPACP